MKKRYKAILKNVLLGIAIIYCLHQCGFQIIPIDYDAISERKPLNGVEFLELEELDSVNQIERHVYNIRSKKIYDEGIVKDISLKRDENLLIDGMRRGERSRVAAVWRANLEVKEPQSIVFTPEESAVEKIAIRVNKQTILSTAVDPERDITHEFKPGIHHIQVDFLNNQVLVPDMSVELNPNPFSASTEDL